MTFAKESGKPIRLVGTFDENGTLLFSRGYKNFQDKNSCNWCRVKRPWMKRFARAKKGEPVVFSEETFCEQGCYRKWVARPTTGTASLENLPDNETVVW